MCDTDFERVMEHTKQLVKNRTCENCIDKETCDKSKKFNCVNPLSGFHQYWRGVQKEAHNGV